MRLCLLLFLNSSLEFVLKWIGGHCARYHLITLPHVCTGAAGAYEKQTVPVHVDDNPREHFHPSTPTAGGAKRRRSSRRAPGWRDPRKILFAFAAL
jgi:hypothetical protein